MITVATSIELDGVSPNNVFDWWLSMDNIKYTRWHPEHKWWQWKSKEQNARNVGDRVSFGEQMGEYSVTFTGRLFRAERGKYLKFRHSYLPVDVSFRFEPTETGTKVEYELQIGFNGPLGKAVDLLLGRKYACRSFRDSLVRHVHEEHKLLERLLS